MDKLFYPAVFHQEPEAGGFSVEFPDLPGCVSEGDTLAEAVEMAKDALGIYLYTLKEDNKEMPVASFPASVKTGDGDFVMLVEWDELEYLKATDNSSVKKTLTIPGWMNYVAEKNEINFSKLLQRAIKTELNLA